MIQAGVEGVPRSPAACSPLSFLALASALGSCHLPLLTGCACPPPATHICGFQGDQGGLRTLQKKWTSFLKARLICSRPDSNLVFNVLRDVFVLRSPDLKEPVFYGVFTPQL